jgi:hypothetical protein
MSAGNPRVLALVAFGAALLRSGPARGDDPRLAEDLFERGRQAIASGDYQLARAQFEASYQAERAPGALLNLAVCEENLGLWNAAIKHLDQVLHEVADQDRRRAAVAARLDELRGRVPHLTLRSEAPLATGVVVSLDAVAIDPASLGTPIPVDPGSHVVRCQRAHETLCLHAFDAQERDSIEWWIRFDSTPVAIPASPLPAPVAPHVTSAGAARRRPPALAIWIGGAGLASLALGLVAGAQVLASKDTMDHHCDATGCDPAGVAAATSGKAWSWVSTIATGVGAVGLGTAVAISVTTRPSQGPGAQVAVSGHF